MKTIKFLLGAAFALCLFTFLGCPPPHPTVTSDIIARYPFDGNLLDSSGHHHDATARGSVRYGVDVSGRPGKALILNGHAILTVADSPDLHFTPTSSFSIYTWIRTADTGDAGILCKGPASNAVPGYRLEIKGGHPRAEITAAGSNIDIIGTRSLADNNWHLVTMTVSPDTVNLYLDTTLVGQRLHAQLRPDSAMGTNTLRIGSKPDGAGGLVGRFDQMAIEGRALSKANVVENWGGIIGTLTMADLPPGEVDLGSTPLLGMCWSDSVVGLRCGTSGLIERTTNGGANWNSVWGAGASPIPEDLYGIASASPLSMRCVAVGTGNTVGNSSDGGQSWATVQIPLGPLATQLGLTGTTLQSSDVHLYAVQFLSSTTVVAIGSVQSSRRWYGVVLVSQDGGTTWNPQRFAGGLAYAPHPIYCIGYATGSNFFEVGGSQGQMFKGSQAGGSWSNAIAPLGPVSLSSSANVTGCCFDGVGAGVAVTDQGEILEGSSTGSWALVHTGLNGLYTAATVGTGTFVVAGDQGLVMKRTSSGTWSTPASPSGSTFWLWTSVRPTATPSVALLGSTAPTKNFWWLP